jgi:hypothetical protein
VSIDQTWVVTQIICDPLLPMFKQCGFEPNSRLLVVVRYTNFHFHFVHVTLKVEARKQFQALH